MQTEQQTYRPSALIHRSSPTPLYFQVSDAIRRAIAAGELRPGQELPTEAGLCALFGVSRITVRQALSELLSDGTLVRKRPRGPLIVNPPRILREVSELSGPFVDAVLSDGTRRRTVVLEAVRESATPSVASRLSIAVGAAVYRIKRLHFGDDEPLAHQVSWLPEALVPGFLECDLTLSLQHLYESRYNRRFVRKVQRICSRSGTDEEASLLAIRRGSPILEIQRTVLLADGHVIEHTVYALRGDRFAIVSEISRPSLPSTQEG